MGRVVKSTYKCTSLSVEDWKQVISDMKQDDVNLQIIQILYDSDGYRLNAGVIAELLGYSSHSPLNRAVGRLGERIYNEYELVDYPIRDDGTIRWWNIVFDGEDVYENGNMKCYWIIKPEMLTAINESNLFKGSSRTLNLRNKNLHEQIKAYKDIAAFEGKERKSIIKIRCNQGRIRNNALRKYRKCEICGLQISQLLIASHIKPWSISNPSEKADINNIMLLCPMHDALFDKYLISFDNDGKILINSDISSEERKLLSINDNQKIEVNEKRKLYLENHKKEFDKHNK